VRKWQPFTLEFSKLFALLAAITCTLGAQTSSVVLTTSPNPSVFGATVTLTATVTPPSATGKVTFYDGAAVLGVSTISAGQASLHSALSGPNVRNLTARYAGNSTYSGSTSSPVSQTVQAAASLGFRAAVNYPAGESPQSLAAGDFNGDGKVDLAVASIGEVSIFLGAGDGSFANPSVYQAGSGQAYVAVADFNGDGVPDIALVSQSQFLNILLGNSNGTLQPISASYPTGPQPVAIAVADFDGDGNADVMIADQVNNNILVFLGKGDGTFHNAATYTISLPSSIAVGDFNGDGVTDAAVGSYDGSVYVFLGNGDGTLRAPVNNVASVVGASVVAGYFNHDGFLDLAAECITGTAILLGNGDGTFQPAITSITGNFSSIFPAVGDFFGDGRLELAVPDTNDSAAAIFISNGDGTFLSSLKYEVGNVPVMAIAADFNGDGRTDLATVNAYSGNISVLLGEVAYTNPTVSAVSVNPATGSGFFQTFTFSFSDPAGAADLASATAMISNASGTSGSCAVTYSRAQNTLALLNDQGMITNSSPPGIGNQQNSQCVLVGGQSSVTQAGNLLTLTLTIGFEASPVCCGSTWGDAISVTGSTSGWQFLGSFSSTSSGLPPQTVSVLPASGSGAGQTFTFVYNDPDGATDLSSVQAIVNASQNAASSCYLSADPVGGTVSLASDGGTSWLGPLTLGTAGTLQNSQCTVDAGASTGAILSNTYTLQLALSFSPGFAGAKSSYGYAASRQNRNSGWQALGAWTVTAPAACTPNVTNIQQLINEALGMATPAHDMNADGFVNILDVQMGLNAALGQCSAP
jgi:Bacterial Ig-like domain (group 3)/FG-GAP-like repeat